MSQRNPFLAIYCCIALHGILLQNMHSKFLFVGTTIFFFRLATIFKDDLEALLMHNNQINTTFAKIHASNIETKEENTLMKNYKKGRFSE